MLRRLVALLFAATALRGCATYEYEHEIWLRVDGSGTVNLTGRPALWTAFKSLPLDPQGDADELVDAAAVARWAAAYDPRPKLIELAGAEHFFHGRLTELRELVMRFLEGPEQAGSVWPV